MADGLVEQMVWRMVSCLAETRVWMMDSKKALTKAELTAGTMGEHWAEKKEES